MHQLYSTVKLMLCEDVFSHMDKDTNKVYWGEFVMVLLTITAVNTVFGETLF